MTSGFGKNMDKGTNTHFTLITNTNESLKVIAYMKPKESTDEF